MNATKARKYDAIKEELNKEDKISIISCNTCVRLSQTGGEEKLKELAMKLRADGYKIQDGFLITAPCQDHYINNVTITPDIDTIVMLACSSGCANAQYHFEGKKIVPALEDRGMLLVGQVTLKNGTTKTRKVWRRTQR